MKLKTLRLLILSTGFCLLFGMSPILVFTQTRGPIRVYIQTKGPIDKEGLKQALAYKVLSSSELIEEVKQRGVNFELSVTDEQEIRLAGRYLSETKLDKLITAIRNNYRPDEPTEDEMALALARSMQKPFISESGIKLEKIEKLGGCKSSGYSAAYVCRYTRNTSIFTSSEAVNRLLGVLTGRKLEDKGPVTIKEIVESSFVWSKEGWIVFKE